MTDQSTGLLSAKVSEKYTTVDPADSKTWWATQAAEREDRLTITAQGPDHIMALSGLEPRRFHTDAAAHMAAEAAVSAYYGLDGLMLGEDVYDIEAEALGQKMIYGEAMPTIDFREPLIAQKSDLAKLKVPEDWLSRGRVQYMFDIQRDLTNLGAQTAFYCAPFSLAVGIRSYPKLIRDMRHDPSFAHDLFACLVDEIQPSYLKALSVYAGASAFNGADAWAAYPNLSPELMEEWVIPYTTRLTANCQKEGLIATTVAGGDYCEEDLSRFDKDILYQCFDNQSKSMFGMPFAFMGMGRWHDYPLDIVAEYLAERYEADGARATITAGINARFMREASPEQIADFVKKTVDLFGRRHDLSIFIASTPADTPAANVHAAVAATRTYGKLPIADNLDDIQLELPQRETFQEYVAKMSNGQGLPF